MTIRLTIKTDSSAPAEVAQELCTHLENQNLKAQLEFEPLPEGARGIPTLSSIVLGLITPESLSTLFTTICGFLLPAEKSQPEQKLEIAVTRANGDQLTLTAQNVSAEAQAETLAHMKAFFEDKKTPEGTQ